MSYPKLFIQLENQDEFAVDEKIKGLKFLEETTSPAFTNNYQDIIGMDGTLYNFSTFAKSSISCKFILKTGNYEDLQLAKHEIYSWFGNRSLIRIRTSINPGIVEYVLPTPFEIKPNVDGSQYSEFEIKFDNPSGYKLSKLPSDKLISDSSSWEIGMNLPTNKNLTYQFTTDNFQVYNPSDIKIDPYYEHHDFKIILKFNGSNCQICNNTNGSSWKYNNGSNGQDNIILDGITCRVNGTPASSNTDYGSIVLDKGWNDIKINGVNSVNSIFSFPFIYL